MQGDKGTQLTFLTGVKFSFLTGITSEAGCLGTACRALVPAQLRSLPSQLAHIFTITRLQLLRKSSSDKSPPALGSRKFSWSCHTGESSCLMLAAQYKTLLGTQKRRGGVLSQC